MSTIIQNSATTLFATLRTSGAVDVISASDTLQAEVLGPDASTVLAGPFALQATTPGAKWSDGVVAVPISSAISVALPVGDVFLRITRDPLGTPQRWFFQHDVAASGTLRSALFDRQSVIDELRRDRLMLAAKTIMPNVTVSDDYLWGKVRAAEAEAQRLLRVFFQPTVMIPDGNPDEIAALPPGTAWAEEPAYDYEPDRWRDESWGFIVTRQSPIISIDYVKFIYPAPMSTIWDVPADWFRLNKKYGQIRFVPASTAFSAPLTAFVMQSVGGGKTIPNMIRIRYTAGLQNAAQDFPDLLDVVKKMAVLKVIQDSFLPASGSISADGLSQSMSVDVTKYQDTVENILFGPKGSNGGLYAAIHGVVSAYL